MRVDQLYGSLRNYRLIRKALCVIYDIAESDWELLIDLASLDHFTQKDFKEGIICSSWERDRIARFIKEGYIKQIYRHSGRPGDHSKYTLELSWKIKVKGMYKILFNGDDIPESKLERMAKSAKSRHLLKRVKKYNKQKKL